MSAEKYEQFDNTPNSIPSQIVSCKQVYIQLKNNNFYINDCSLQSELLGG